MNRKGFIGDVAFVVAILLVAGMVFIVMAKVLTDINDDFQAGDTLSNESKNLSGTLTSRYTGLFDGIFAVVFGLLGVGLIVSVALLGSRPEFFFITIIVGFIVIGLAAMISNVFDSFANSSISATAASFTYIPLIMNNLVEITLFLVAALVAGLYIKARGII